MGNLPISVIIIAKNAEKTIEECLSAVQRNSPAEIIVVDGNSTDRTVDIAQSYTERVYSDGGRGKSYARQLGAEQARQEHIAYIDSDVILTEGALATMFTEFQGSDCISIGARGAHDIKSSTYWEWAQHQHVRLACPEDRPPDIGMAACLFRRETILKYGFELSFGGYMDDIDLAYRLRKEGHRFALSSAQIYHYAKADLKSFVSYRFFFGRLKPYYIRKFGPWHAGFWPPMCMLYWVTFCLFKGKLKLIPYEIVDGVVETAGMVKGFFELAGILILKKTDT